MFEKHCIYRIIDYNVHSNVFAWQPEAVGETLNMTNLWTRVEEWSACPPTKKKEKSVTLAAENEAIKLSL